jgi:P pilus assembly chaperone PapD
LNRAAIAGRIAMTHTRQSGRAAPIGQLTRNALSSLLLAAAPVAGLALGLATVATPATAQDAGAANLNISPRRVIFTPAERSAAIYVFNQGSAAVLVDVSLADNVMLRSGEIVPLASAEGRGADFAEAARRLRSAKDLILATPSRISLPPGEGRTVRLRALMPDAGEAQELRTHLTVTTVPSPDAGLTAESAAAAQSDELRFRVQTTFGISIPLIVRTGALTAAAQLGAMSLDRAAEQDKREGVAAILVVPVNRSGAKSLYGNVEVRSGSGKSASVIGMVRGVGIYAEQDQRIVRVPLSRAPAPGESLSVTLTDEEGGSGRTLLTGSFIAP